MIQPGGGRIRFLGLTTWWTSAFTAAERARIDEVFSPVSSGPKDGLTEGEILSSSETAIGLVGALVGWFVKPGGDEELGRKLVAKARALAETTTSDPIGRHFAYLNLIRWYYRRRETTPGALAEAEAMCRAQIALAPEVIAAFKADPNFNGLPPEHTGYSQLGVILKKSGRLAERDELLKDRVASGW